MTDAGREQRLDAYEHELQLTPEWISIEGAIAFNERVPAVGDARWVRRELAVLRSFGNN